MGLKYKLVLHNQTVQSLHIQKQASMSSVHYGRGSEAKGMHFYQTIQLCELQDQELVTILNSPSSFLPFHSFFRLLKF